MYYTGDLRGEIKGLRDTIAHILQRDIDEEQKAKRKGAIPLLVAGDDVTFDAFTQLLTHCNDALAVA